MPLSSYYRWWVSTVTFGLAVCCAVSLTYWVLRFVGASKGNLPVAVAVATPEVPDPQRLAQLLGAGRAAPVVEANLASASRFSLSGVVAQGHGRGYALISVEGAPAKAFRIGAPVTTELVLRRVSAHEAELAPTMSGTGAAPVVLQLPKATSPTVAPPTPPAAPPEAQNTAPPAAPPDSKIAPKVPRMDLLYNKITR